MYEPQCGVQAGFLRPLLNASCLFLDEIPKQSYRNGIVSPTFFHLAAVWTEGNLINVIGKTEIIKGPTPQRCWENKMRCCMFSSYFIARHYAYNWINENDYFYLFIFISQSRSLQLWNINRN